MLFMQVNTLYSVMPDVPRQVHISRLAAADLRSFSTINDHAAIRHAAIIFVVSICERSDSDNETLSAGNIGIPDGGYVL